MHPIKDYLRQRGIAYSETAEGDIYFQGGDRRPMFIRAYDDGTYDWSVNDADINTNLLDYREPMRRSEVEVLERIDALLSKHEAGTLLLDTLGMVERALALGLSREQAEQAVSVAREAILAMHDSGMDAKEIRARFAEQPRHGGLPRAQPEVEKG